MIKSRPWCEAFCWGSSGFLTMLSLDVSLRGYITKCLCCLFSQFIVYQGRFHPHHGLETSLIYVSYLPSVIVNLLDIKLKIRLDFDAVD